MRGLYWYHPHVNSSEQVGHGLSGVFIVEEPREIAQRLRVDRELFGAIDDWRSDDAAQLQPFGNRHDASHGGRFGNVVTLNGSQTLVEPVRAGERVRLRLGNLANAQVFFLRLQPLDPWLIAIDGHPVAPIRLRDGGVWLGPGLRADLVVDIDLDPGANLEVLDTAYGPNRAQAIMSWRVLETRHRSCTWRLADRTSSRLKTGPGGRTRSICMDTAFSWRIRACQRIALRFCGIRF